MTVRELIEKLQEMPPAARAILSWEGELLAVREAVPVRAHRTKYHGQAGEYKRCEGQWCWSCEDDRESGTRPEVVDAVLID